MSYQSDYSGAQVDEAVGKALNPDATPTQNSTALITSGGVKSAINSIGTSVELVSPRQTGGNLSVESLAHFRFLYAALFYKNGSSYHCTAANTMPLDVFKNGIRAQVETYIGNARHFGIFAYSTDTIVTLFDLTNIDGNYYIGLYGIK